MYRGSSSSRRSVGALCALVAALGLMAFGALSTASAKEEVCSSGAHTLSHFGDHVYPEMGNGGYKSVHTDVNLVYDAPDNEFLAGNNVELTQLSTQCLTDFSLDFARHTPENEEGPGADMEVQKVFVNGVEVPFEFVQPTYPGDPNGQNDPDPAAHQTGLDTPASATNPLPPACSPEGPGAAESGLPCPARKLVITPTAPIPSGETFVVKVEYTGHPGVYTDSGEEADGWFVNPGDGAFVTTEPVGTEAWMPLNNHPSAKPTYNFTEKVTKGRTVIANGELVKPEGGGLAEENPPDEQFPEGSTTWRWHSPEPIANYLVENSIGDYELLERKSADGVIYYEAQGGAISATQKAKNKLIMDQQEDITHFQERFNGPFPFTTDGVVVGVPEASFEEEMQGKITFNGGQIGLTTFNHENMHQWWGDNVSESNFNETFFKEGMARLSEYLQAARIAAEAAGGLDTPAGEAAFDASLIARFHTNYIATGTMWTRAPSNPNPVTLFSTPTTYNRPATAYIALRQILGKGNFASVLKQVQREFGGGSITESQWENAFKEHLPNQSPACRSRLNQFFGEWFDTEFPAAGSAESLRPQLTGPGLDVSASGTTFYNADGTCKRVAPPPPVTTATISPNPVEGKVVGPATVTLQGQDPNSGIAKTEFKVDGAKAFSVYTVPFTISGFAPHTVEFRSTNGDGTLEATKSVTFTVVKHEAPTTSATVSPNPVEGKIVGPATVTLSAKDNGAGVTSTEFKLDGGAFQPYTGPFTVTGFAAHTVEFRSTNGDGAVEETKQVAFTVEPHAAPTTSATVLPNPVGGKVVGPATVTLVPKDNGSGVAKTEFKLDNGAFQTYNGTFTVTGFAQHTIEFRSTNGDGVVEANKTVTFTEEPHAAPTTSASVQPPPVGGRVTGPAKVSLTAKDNGGGIASTEISVDGVGFQPYQGPVTVAAFGDHTVQFRSTNSDGVVETTKQVAFTVVQHAAPVTSAEILPEPVEGKVTGPARVVLSAKGEGADITGTEFSLDGGAFQPYDGAFTVSAFGDHTVQFRSSNADGAVEEAKQVAFTVVAHDAPVTTAAVVPAPVEGKVTGPASVVLDATDPGIDVTGTEYSLDGGPFQPYNGPISVAALGDHTVEFRSTNGEGTVEAAKRTTFTVVAPQGPPPPKPVCENPHLTVAVSHPMRRAKGVATLLRGRAYRYTGRLTCGAAGTPAPAGTVVQVLSQVGNATTGQPGVVVGEGGKIDTLLQFSSKRTVIFRFAADGVSAEAKVRIAVARR